MTTTAREKGQTFNESDARVFYNFLGHRPNEYTEIRIIKWLPKGGGQVKQEFVQSEEEFIKVLKKWNGKRQCYAGLNPRKTKGGKIEHVARVTAILFDVDSGHPKNQPASDDELSKAEDRMKSLKEWIRLRGYSQPLVAMSGNGFHVIHKVNIEINDNTQSQLEKYHHETADDLDSMFDIPRIVKIPGTLSIKGAPTEERPHRLSYIVDKGSKTVDTALGEHICSIEVDKTDPLSTASTEQESKMTDTFENNRGRTLAYFRRQNNKLDRLLTTEVPSGYPSASEADMATLSMLLKREYNDREAVTILRHFRWREKLDRRNYIPKMLEKIHSDDIEKETKYLEMNPEDNQTKKMAKMVANEILKQKQNFTTITATKAFAEAEGFIGVTREIASLAKGYVQYEYKKRSESGDDVKERKPTIATVITNMALDADILFFRDKAQQAYARLKVDDHWEIWPVRSTRFKEFLVHGYRAATAAVPNSHAVRDATMALSAHAVQEGPVYSLHNRVAWFEKAIWYDLTNENWEVVRIDENGWEILPNTPRPMFRRFDHQIPQVYPVNSEDKSPEQLMNRFMKLMTFHNHEHELNHILDITSLVFCLVPEVPHPASLVYGPAGSGKTRGFHATVKKLVDPSNTEDAGLSVPGKTSDFPLQFQRHYYLIYSNMSYVTREQADIFCRAIDGSASETRRLYTDDDMISFRYTRCLGINAIPLLGTQEDLMDRSILFPLESLSRESRMDEEELQEKFEEVRPEILGAMFDTLSASMRIKPTIELGYIERMGAYTKWGFAIAQALNYDTSVFLKAYATNRASANIEIIEADPVGRTVYAFMENKDVWLGAPKEFFLAVETFAFGEKEKRPRGWPKDENVFGRRLARIHQNLERAGLLIEDSKSGSRVKTISWHEGYGPETAQRTLDDMISLIEKPNRLGGMDSTPLLLNVNDENNQKSGSKRNNIEFTAHAAHPKVLQDIVQLWGDRDIGQAIKADGDNMEIINKGFQEGYLEEYSPGEWGITAKTLNELAEE